MMKKTITFCCSFAILCCLAWTNLHAQSLAFVQLQNNLAARANELTDGYAQYLKGDYIGYDNLWNDNTNAFLTRTSDGKNAIEWQSAVNKKSVDGKFRYILLVASDQVSKLVKFHLSVNGKEVLTFNNQPDAHWVKKSDAGVEMEFIRYAQNAWKDGMAFVIITVPEQMAKEELPTTFKIVGENAESNTWFMVFKTPNLTDELVKRAKTDEHYDIDITSNSLRIVTTSNIIGKNVRYTLGATTAKAQFVRSGEYAELKLPLKKTSTATPFTLTVDNDKVVELSDINNPQQKSTLGEDYLRRIEVTAQDANSTQLAVMKSRNTSREQLRNMAQSAHANSKVYIMVSSHQDIAWMDSPYQCVEDRDRLIVSPALELLEKHPDYRYDIEDALIIEEYLERHPDKRGLMAHLIKNGQLGVGASYTQPYEEYHTGEALVRQFYFGKRWIDKTFEGSNQRTYWNVDVPGRTLQMPQILKKSGVDYLMYSRHEAGIYNWLSPDNSSVLTFTPGHYTVASQFLHKSPEMAMGKFVEFLSNYPDYRTNKSQPAVIGMLSAEDMSTARTYYDWIDAMKTYGKEMNITTPTIVHSTADMFMDAVSKAGGSFHEIKGERPNLWQYIHAPSHESSIAAYRIAAQQATAAETFSTIRSLLANDFSGYPTAELNNIWKSIIYPDHGWGGNKGFITDSLFHSKYTNAEKESAKLLKQSLADISNNIKFNPKKGTPVVVYNNLSWNRTEPARVLVKRSDLGKVALSILSDEQGKAVPFQISSEDKNSDKVEIEFIAENIPSLGYRSYYLEGGFKMQKMVNTEDESYQYYDLLFENGLLKQITDKELGQGLFNTDKFAVGDLICMRSVGNGAGEFSTMQKPTMDHYEQASLKGAKWEKTASGPVFTSYTAKVKFKEADIVCHMKVYKSIKRIDFDTDVLQFTGSTYLEFRQMFPMAAKMEVSYEVPFGTVTVGKDEMKGKPGERYQDEAKDIHPRSILNWISASDKSHNVILSSSVVVADYIDPTDNPTNNTILQPLLLASRRSCHYLGDFYYQKGDHHFKFSLSSNKGGWEGGAHQGVSANNPLLTVYNPRSFADASLPESASFFSVDNRNVMISTIKKAEDDNETVIRLYDAIGGASQVKLNSLFNRAATSKINLIEMDQKAYSNDLLQVGNKAIEAYKFKFNK